MLKIINLLVGQSVRFCDDGNKVDLAVKAAHNLDVQGLEGVTCWLDEVDTSVDSVVDDIHAVDLVFSIQVCIEALLDILHDRLPRIIVVDEISKTWRIDNCQAETDAVLFNVCTDGLDGNSLGNDVKAWPLAFFWRVQRGVEKGVNEGGFPEARLACITLVC